MQFLVRSIPKEKRTKVIVCKGGSVVGPYFPRLRCQAWARSTRSSGYASVRSIVGPRLRAALPFRQAFT
eukprot:8016424-Alexandrium_andersonii.AAC.1